ncbi:MAG: hypothetical protein LUD03_05205 [Firmicutes bacterium]|nr:hypothetical protein [Bacillota bacterium]
MRELYKVLFAHYHLLPDGVGRQNPRVLFDMLSAFNKSDEPDIPKSAHLDMFYGK